MSQEVISQKISRTCEGCGKIVTWETIGASDETLNEMQSWYTIIREIVIESRFAKLVAQACYLSCVPSAAIKLVLPPQEQSDRIDLDSLRTASRIN